jgi:radical SAM superfamily enzyme YgiQ (UPF0313 family)
MTISQFKNESFSGKIAFLNPNSRNRGFIPTAPPYSLMTLMGLCRTLSIPYAFIDAEAYHMDDTAILAAIHKTNCDYVGLTLFSMLASKLFPLLNRIKKETKTVIIVGGPLPTADTKWLMETCPAIDYAVSGPGEKILPQLLLSIEKKASADTVPGVSYWDGSTLVINKQNYQKFDSEIQIAPDFDAIDYRFYPGLHPAGAWPSANIVAIRGCPYRCTFCSNPVWGGKVKMPPVPIVIEWLELLAKKGIKHVFFGDDTLNINNSWFEELCKSIVKNRIFNKMLFRCMFRSDLTTKNQLELARKAGFWLIAYGVESANQTVLDYYQKREKIEDSARAIEMTHAAGLHSIANFIAGAPVDTVNTLLETANFIRDTSPTIASLQWLIPYIGAEVSNDIIDKGILSKSQIREYNHMTPTIHTLTLSSSELGEIIEYIRNDILRYKQSAINRLKRQQQMTLNQQKTEQISQQINYEIEQAESLLHHNQFISAHIDMTKMPDDILLYTSDIRLKSSQWHNSEFTLRWSRPVFELPFFLNEEKQYLEIYWASMRSNVNIEIILINSEGDQILLEAKVKMPAWHKKTFHISRPLKGTVWMKFKTQKPFFAPNDPRELGMAFKSIHFL